jgi:cytochrome b561
MEQENPMDATQYRYTKTAVWLHWIIAILIVFLLFPGHELIEVRRGGDLSDWGPTAHASLGVLVFLLSLFRMYWRVTHRAPALPTTMPRWQMTASHALHGLFYVMMLALPLTGWLALQNFGSERLNPEAVSFFKMFSLYGFVDLGGWTGEAHEIAGNVTKAMLALHVLAALKHQFWDKDGLLRRMSPH